MKILIIHGDPKILEGVATALRLQWHDATILTATSAESGLRLFFDHDPDMLLLEIGLPDLSGMDVLRQIRRVSDVPILELSSGRTTSPRCERSSSAQTSR
jgi:DNA-binding response OmpR family regulator